MYSKKVAAYLLIVPIALCVSHAIHAQAAPNPAMYAEVRGIDDQEHRQALRIVKLDIDVELQGAVAVTTMQATFAGMKNETLEGHFALALPAGSVTTGYALNVGETMIDGVLGPKEQLREIYESNVRKKIDPGFAEVSSADVFTTKIYPIDEEGRTIRIRFATPSIAGYALPINLVAPVDSVTITLHTPATENAPVIQFPLGMNAVWKGSSDGLVASANFTGQPVVGAVQLTRALPIGHVEVNRRSTGERYFQIAGAVSELALPNPKRVRIYWDTSTSRRDDQLEREIELATDYVNRIGAPVDLVLFSSGGAQRIEVVSGQALKAQLADLTYRGASSIDVLGALKLPAADRCLLFSDGQITIGRRDSFAPKCTTSTITSVSDANHAWLARTSRIGGGQSMNLDSTSNTEALHRLVTIVRTVSRATDNKGRALAFSVVQQTTKEMLVVGEAPRSGAIILHVRNSDGSEAAQEYQSPRAETVFDGTSALWARDRVLEMSLQNPWSKELTRLSRYYGIANDQLAFVVLEQPEDYVLADLAPPATYPEEALAEYREEKAEHDEELLEAYDEHLETLRDQWTEIKTWWGEQRKPTKTDAATKLDGVNTRPSAGVGRFRRSSGGGGGGGGGTGTGLEEVVVTGSLIQAPGISIHMDPWQPTRPYLTALDIADNRRLDLVLSEQEQQHGSLPGFYLDVAEWMYRHGHKDQAQEMALSALDVPLANIQTLSVVANRLLRYGDANRAVDLYERVHDQASHLPQTKLQLAVALAKRAAKDKRKQALIDLNRALGLLNEVVTHPSMNEYEGIELIALMEANGIIPLYRKLGGNNIPLASEFIAKLDIDIRVLIQWNTPGTDLDLWVAEPNGEKASYQNTRTTSGGRISNDMTSGYGPEEYLLRFARQGQYEIAVDVFATDAINPNGPTVVTARLIRNFGRSNQSEEYMDIELLPGIEDDVRVGRFNVR